MNESFFNDKFRLWSFTALAISILIQAGLIFLSWGKLPTQIPIFYSLPWGNDILAAPMFLWILPSATLAFGILDFLIIKSISDNKFLSNALVLTVFMMSFMNTFSTVKIIALLI